MTGRLEQAIVNGVKKDYFDAATALKLRKDVRAHGEDIEYQVVQKLHGATEPESERAHDLIDAIDKSKSEPAKKKGEAK